MPDYFPPAQPLPFIIFYVIVVLPIAIFGLWALWKEDIIKPVETRRTVILVIIAVVFLYNVCLNTYLHFGLPYLGL
jgi:hypothetical protein